MKKAVLLFDLDDTLLYQERINRDIIRGISRRLFPGADTDHLVGVFFQTARELWEDLPTFPWTRMIGISAGEGLWGDFTGDNKQLRELKPLAENYRILVWQETLDRLGASPSQKSAEALAAEFYRERRERIVLVEDAERVLRILQPDYNLGLLTNGAPDLQRFKIEQCGLAGYFDTITVSGEVGVGKPRAEVFQAAMAPFPADLPRLMIGNSQTSDIQGAVNAGIPSIWFDLGEDSPMPNLRPAAVVRTLAEIPSILPSIGF